MRWLISVVLMLAAISGCGGEELTPAAEREGDAEGFIEWRLGHPLDCSLLGTGKTGRVWHCSGSGLDECWTTKILGSGTHINHAERSEGGDLLKSCPVVLPDEFELPEGTSSDPAAEDLYAIEFGHEPDGDELEFKRIVFLLDRMQEECPANTRTELADYTANVMLQLEDAGVEAKPIEILEDVRESSTLREFAACLDLFTFYTLLRRDQG